MKILYSFNKKGYEAAFWTREIAAASNAEVQFIPFNHDPYVEVRRYLRAQHLDELYYDRHPGLMRLYAEVEARVYDEGIDAIVVDNCFPYHPDWLRRLCVYKVMRTTDGPLAAYDRDFAYVHAYDHIIYHSPAYSRDLGMEEKLRYVGAKRTDFLPLSVFDAAFNTSRSEEEVCSLHRDIDVIFVGAQYLGKMPFLAQVKKAFGQHCQFYGYSTFKKNAYFNLKYGFPGWVRPVSYSRYIQLCERTKIGFNLHNRGKYTVGSYRLFELPANGVMQISDGGEYLNRFFTVGEEIIGYENIDELIDLIRHYLAHDEERLRIARNGYRKVMSEYRFHNALYRMACFIASGKQRKAEDVLPAQVGV